MNWPLTSRLVNTVASRPITYLKKSCLFALECPDQVTVGQCAAVDHRLVDVLLVEELAADDQRDVAGLGRIVERGAEVVDAVAIFLEDQVAAPPLLALVRWSAPPPGVVWAVALKCCIRPP